MIRLAITYLLCFMFCLIIACSKKESSVKEQYQVVTTILPKYESYPVNILTSGNIEAWQEAIIGSEIGGLDIVHVYANVGDKVKKGQLLAELNAAQVNADLLSQKANVLEANANSVQAKTEANQAITLEKVGALSAQELLQYSTKDKTTQAQLVAANANLDLQKLKLSYTKIIAPESGIISSRSATVGAIVSNGGELFRLIIGNHLEWQAEVSLDQLQNIESGQVVVMQLNDGSNISGKVRQVSPTLNSNSKNAIVYVDILSNNQLKIGTSIDGAIKVNTKYGLMIPFKSIISSDGFNYVMTVNKQNKVHKTKVILGGIINNNVVIQSGIDKSNLVVVDGALFLNESDTVTIRR